SENRGQLYVNVSFGCAAANLPVDRVDAGGAHADSYFAGTDSGLVHVFHLQLVRVSEFFQYDCLHESAPLRRGVSLLFDARATVEVEGTHLSKRHEAGGRSQNWDFGLAVQGVAGKVLSAKAAPAG